MGLEIAAPPQLRARTKRFALAVVRLVSMPPKTEAGRIIGRQLLRSATSVAANYRSAGRARSRKEFGARIGVVLEEADESLFWLELLKESELLLTLQTDGLIGEATELVKIFSAAHRTASRTAARISDPSARSSFTRSPD
jgi:four helix bundle protein